MRTIFKLTTAFLAAQCAFAAIKMETVEYKEGDTTLEGVLIYDDSFVNRRPGVLIAHQWKGLTDYEKKRGEMLAKLGYVAFAADIYGKEPGPGMSRRPASSLGNIRATATCCAGASRPVSRN